MSLSGCDKGVPGFTIVELLIGMVVCGIVLSASWTALHLINRRAEQAEEGRSRSESLSFFYRCVSNDVAGSTSIVHGENDMLLSEADSTSIHYEFHDSYVIRSCALHADTFPFHVRHVESEEEFPDGFQLQVQTGVEEVIMTVRRSRTAAEKINSDD